MEKTAVMARFTQVRWLDCGCTTLSFFPHQQRGRAECVQKQFQSDHEQLSLRRAASSQEGGQVTRENVALRYENSRVVNEENFATTCQFSNSCRSRHESTQLTKTSSVILGGQSVTARRVVYALVARAVRASISHPLFSPAYTIQFAHRQKKHTEGFGNKEVKNATRTNSVNHMLHVTLSD